MYLLGPMLLPTYLHVLSYPVRQYWLSWEFESLVEDCKKGGWGTSLVAQWLRIHAPNAGGLGSVLGQGVK